MSLGEKKNRRASIGTLNCRCIIFKNESYLIVHTLPCVLVRYISPKKSA